MAKKTEQQKIEEQRLKQEKYQTELLERVSKETVEANKKTRPIRSFKPNLFVSGKRANQADFLAASGAFWGKKSYDMFASEFKKDREKEKKALNKKKKEEKKVKEEAELNKKKAKSLDKKLDLITDSLSELSSSATASLSQEEKLEAKRLKSYSDEKKAALLREEAREKEEEKRRKERERYNQTIIGQVKTWGRNFKEQGGLQGKIFRTITSNLDGLGNVLETAYDAKLEEAKLKKKEEKERKREREKELNFAKVNFADNIEALKSIDKTLRTNIQQELIDVFDKLGGDLEKMTRTQALWYNDILKYEEERDKKFRIEFGKGLVDSLKEAQENKKKEILELEKRFGKATAEEIINDRKYWEKNQNQILLDKEKEFEEIQKRNILEAANTESIFLNLGEKTDKAFKEIQKAFQELKEQEKESNKERKKEAKESQEAQEKLSSNLKDEKMEARVEAEKKEKAEEERSQQRLDELKGIREATEATTKAVENKKFPKPNSEKEDSGGIISGLLTLLGVKFLKPILNKLGFIGKAIGGLATAAGLGDIFGMDILPFDLGNGNGKGVPKTKKPPTGGKRGFFRKALSWGKRALGFGIGGAVAAGGADIVTDVGAKAAEKMGVKETSKVGAKIGTKIAAKTAGKAGLKSIIKKVPVLGAIAGLGFGISRALSGDLAGAGLEVASGVASMFPGVGTAASVGIDAALMAKDISGTPVPKGGNSKKILPKVGEKVRNIGSNFKGMKGIKGAGAGLALAGGIGYLGKKLWDFISGPSEEELIAKAEEEHRAFVESLKKGGLTENEIKQKSIQSNQRDHGTTVEKYSKHRKFSVSGVTKGIEVDDEDEFREGQGQQSKKKSSWSLLDMAKNAIPVFGLMGMIGNLFSGKKEKRNDGSFEYKAKNMDFGDDETTIEKYSKHRSFSISGVNAFKGLQEELPHDIKTSIPDGLLATEKTQILILEELRELNKRNKLDDNKKRIELSKEKFFKRKADIEKNPLGDLLGNKEEEEDKGFWGLLTSGHPIDAMKSLWKSAKNAVGLGNNGTTSVPSSTSVQNFPAHNGGQGKAFMTRNAQGGRVIHYPNGDIKEGGTRNWRNNNPGNIKYNENMARNYGAIGSDGTFAIFPSMEAGFKAQAKLLLEGKNYRNLTLGQAISRWAPPSENNTAAYIQSVAGAVGISPNTPMSQLTKEQGMKIVKAMARHEGAKVGTLRKANGVSQNPSLGGGGGGSYGTSNAVPSSGENFASIPSGGPVNTPMGVGGPLINSGVNPGGDAGTNNAVNYAKQFLGKYQYSMNLRNRTVNGVSYLDCSSFVQKVIKGTGIDPNFPSTTRTQVPYLTQKVGQGVAMIASPDQLQAGDLVYFMNGAHHVVMMADNDHIIHSSSTKNNVVMAPKSYITSGWGAKHLSHMFRYTAKGKATQLQNAPDISQVASSIGGGGVAGATSSVASSGTQGSPVGQKTGSASVSNYYGRSSNSLGGQSTKLSGSLPDIAKGNFGSLVSGLSDSSGIDLSKLSGSLPDIAKGNFGSLVSGLIGNGVAGPLTSSGSIKNLLGGTGSLPDIAKGNFGSLVSGLTGNGVAGSLTSSGSMKNLLGGTGSGSLATNIISGLSGNGVASGLLNSSIGGFNALQRLNSVKGQVMSNIPNSLAQVGGQIGQAVSSSINITPVDKQPSISSLSNDPMLFMLRTTLGKG